MTLDAIVLGDQRRRGDYVIGAIIYPFFAFWRVKWTSKMVAFLMAGLTAIFGDLFGFFLLLVGIVMMAEYISARRADLSEAETMAEGALRAAVIQQAERRSRDTLTSQMSMILMLLGIRGIEYWAGLHGFLLPLGIGAHIPPGGVSTFFAALAGFDSYKSWSASQMRLGRHVPFDDLVIGGLQKLPGWPKNWPRRVRPRRSRKDSDPPSAGES